MKPNLTKVLLFASLVFIICVPSLVNQSQFVDSLTYSAIAKDMAIGKSTFWNFYYLSYDIPFRDHPPLSIWLQSLLFLLFKGNPVLPHAIYSLLILFLNVFGIKLIWNLLFPTRKEQVFIPIILWFLTPLIFWSFSNNLLDNTLSAFILFSVYFSLKSIKNNSYFYLFTGAIFCFFAILTKGAVGLFPLITLPIYWVIFRNKKAFFFSLVFLFSTGVFLYLITLNKEASLFLKDYYYGQLLSSISGEREINKWGHFYIIQKLLVELIPVFCVLLLARLLKKLNFADVKKEFYFLLLLGILCSIPLSISPKAHGFYLVPSIAFFALAFSSVISANFSKLNNLLKTKYAYGFALLVFSSSIVFAFNNYNNLGRDEKKIEFAAALRNNLPNEINQVQIARNLETNYVFRGYLARYFQIRTESKNNDLDYEIIAMQDVSDSHVVIIQNELYCLIKKR